MDIISKKINLISNKFKEYKYKLSNENVEDLKYRLNTKPVQLYILSINLLVENDEVVNYDNVINLIKIDIRIRDNIKKLVTALEESIWVKYLDKKLNMDSISDYLKFINNHLKLYDVINHIKEANLHTIRKIRNSVNHLIYPILYNKFDELLIKIKNLKNIPYVDVKTINSLICKIKKVNNEINIGFINKILSDITLI